MESDELNGRDPFPDAAAGTMLGGGGAELQRGYEEDRVLRPVTPGRAEVLDEERKSLSRTESAGSAG